MDNATTPGYKGHDQQYALMGEPGSGKSSIGAELAGEAEVMSFANGVKMEVARALAANLQTPKDWVDSKFWTDSFALFHQMRDPETKDNYRRILQLWGTEFRRQQDENYWVGVLLDTVTEAIEASWRDQNPLHVYRFVVDDCRFPNEYSALRDRGFKFVRLAAGETTRPLDGAAAAHESERYWRDFEVDLELSYEPGPARQAERILEFFEEENHE